MAATTDVILILGAGSNIGESIASKFAEGGYKVALAARSLPNHLSADGRLLKIEVDLIDPTSVANVFKLTSDHLGPPNVVIYNGANRLLTPPEDPLSAPLETIEASRKVGLDSAYVAAQHALQSFRSLAKPGPTAFIYTGNTLNQMPIPGVMPFALGKVSAAMMVEYAANAYGHQGYRFYYADQRAFDGRPANVSRDGPAHAEMYWSLAHEARQSKWLVTFVKGEGRKDFVGVDFDGGTRESYDWKFGRA